MPSAPVAAAATGLPEITSPDFHLSIGREIARLGLDIARADAEIETMHATNSPGEMLVRGSLEHLGDREEALIRVLAAMPAISLSGATLQLAAAIRVFSWITMEETPRPEEERAVSRLLSSALAILIDAAGLDAQRDGIASLANPQASVWVDVYERIDRVFHK